MPFFSLSNIKIRFAEMMGLIWKNYIAVIALFLTKKEDLIDKKEFAAVI